MVQVSERWIYSAVLSFAMDIADQERTGFRYNYSVFQAEYSRNLLFGDGRQMDQVFSGLIDKTRSELLGATEEKLTEIVRATQRDRKPLRGKAAIGVRVGRVLGRSKVAKHFRYEITEDGFSFGRDEDSIAREAALDGIYVIRTNVAGDDLEADEVVRAYKSLSEVEQAFRVLKGFGLEVAPIRHRLDDRVRAHIFLCMLAFYVRTHMEQALAPLLFTDHDPAGAEQRRDSVVQPARRSEEGERKVRRQRTADGLPARSFQTLLADLTTLTKNETRVEGTEITFEK